MIERTQDYRVVKRIIGMDPWISSDVFYLLDDGNLWTLHEVGGQLRIHANMVTYKGGAAIASARRAFKWAFENTDHDKITARIETGKEAAKVRIIASQCMTRVKTTPEFFDYEVNKPCPS